LERTTVGRMGEMIEFESNGSTSGGYLATPGSGGGPGVIVIQEWWGLVDHIVDVCDRFAAAGFVALAPDLYHGKKIKPGEPDEAGKAMMAMRMEQAARDMSGAVDEVLRRSTGDNVGVIGFCMGGGLALVLATQRPDAVAAVVPCYGIIPWPDAQPDYADMSAAVLGHYAEKDDFFTPDAANALADQLRALGKSVEIIIYPGTDHAFFNDTRPEVHDAEASRALWDRTLEFFREHLT
jgi:carboxymethylenebutenolidase